MKQKNSISTPPRSASHSKFYPENQLIKVPFLKLKPGDLLKKNNLTTKVRKKLIALPKHNPIYLVGPIPRFQSTPRHQSSDTAETNFSKMSRKQNKTKEPKYPQSPRSIKAPGESLFGRFAGALGVLNEAAPEPEELPLSVPRRRRPQHMEDVNEIQVLEEHEPLDGPQEYQTPRAEAGGDQDDRPSGTWATQNLTSTNYCNPLDPSYLEKAIAKYECQFPTSSVLPTLQLYMEEWNPHVIGMLIDTLLREWKENPSQIQVAHDKFQEHVRLISEQIRYQKGISLKKDIESINTIRISLVQSIDHLMKQGNQIGSHILSMQEGTNKINANAEKQEALTLSLMTAIDNANKQIDRSAIRPLNSREYQKCPPIDIPCVPNDEVWVVDYFINGFRTKTTWNRGTITSKMIYTHNPTEDEICFMRNCKGYTLEQIKGLQGKCFTT
nr:polymerase-associated protein [Drosophila busckii rhabdovirus]